MEIAIFVVVGLVLIGGWCWFCYHFPVLGMIISLFNLFSN